MLLSWSSNIVLGLMMSFLDVIEVMVRYLGTLCLVWLPLFVIMKSPKTVVHEVLPNHVLAISFVPWSIFVALILGFCTRGQNA